MLSWLVLGQVPSQYYYEGGAAVIVGLLALVGLQYLEQKARDAATALKDADDKGVEETLLFGAQTDSQALRLCVSESERGLSLQ
jgi:hypothetical protein